MLLPEYYEALRPFGNHKNEYIEDPNFYHERLIEVGYLRITYEYQSSMSLMITPAGLEALKEYEYACEQRSVEEQLHKQEATERAMEVKKNRRHEWLLCLASSLVGSVLTLVVEHFTRIVEYISGLFH